MEIIIFRALDRGHFNFGWLDTYHTFSFARYFDPGKMNFGALRVFNDDTVQPGKGFDKHPHDNMEIISIPLKGALLHRDSMNSENIVNENEVQVMSAGTGIFHAEYNASNTESTNFLQIWIFPRERNIKPQYDQRFFDPVEAEDQWQLLVSPHNSDSLQIHQNAYVLRSVVSKGTELKYPLYEKLNKSFLFVIEGSVKVGETLLNDRDAIGLSGIEKYSIAAIKKSILLNIEVPGINN